jgi:hypothetical protein
MKLFVAVVMSQDGQESKRERGDWASFVDEDKDAVIQMALKAKEEWEGSGGPYRVLVGELRQIARPIMKYRLGVLGGHDGKSRRTHRRS